MECVCSTQEVRKKHEELLEYGTRNVDVAFDVKDVQLNKRYKNDR